MKKYWEPIAITWIALIMAGATLRLFLIGIGIDSPWVLFAWLMSMIFCAVVVGAMVGIAILAWRDVIRWGGE